MLLPEYNVALLHWPGSFLDRLWARCGRHCRVKKKKSAVPPCFLLAFPRQLRRRCFPSRSAVRYAPSGQKPVHLICLFFNGEKKSPSSLAVSWTVQAHGGGGIEHGIGATSCLADSCPDAVHESSLPGWLSRKSGDGQAATICVAVEAVGSAAKQLCSMLHLHGWDRHAAGSNTEAKGTAR